MSGNEIRQKFLNFFQERGHKIVPSSSLLPDDPSVLLTSAGMQQFKPYYTGSADPLNSPHTSLRGKPIGSKNAASSQKSFRTSDIDEVGDSSHLTFFEMLGNFSFGGYGKKESIQLAHEFITKEMGLEISYVTIFKGSDIVPKDEESREIWKQLGVDEVREEGMDDVFWGPTGNQGPCGPTTEIYCRNADGKDVEVWNIVFNEYFFPGTREELLNHKKQLQKLKFLGVDTGMGLERLVMIAQNVKTIFDADLLKPLIDMIVSRLNRGSTSVSVTEVEPLYIKSTRIIADHIRGAAFLMADGIRPSNVEQGYILRRIIRRAIRHGSLLNLPQDIFSQLIEKVIELYNSAYPELINEKENILMAFEQEHNKFKDCLEKGLKEFEKLTAQCHALGDPVRGTERIITGAQAFHLYDTYGFPFELTKELAQEQGIKIDEQEFNNAFAVHQKTSRAGLEAKFGGHGLVMDTGELKAASAEDAQKVTCLHTATHLLHQALRQVLGNHIQQRGSDITPERLRFDFTHTQKMTDEEKQQVEDLVNQKIKQDLLVKREEMTYNDAIAKGALAFFKEKYPEKVSVYSVGDPSTGSGQIFSKEICGGPHVQHTGEIGMFKIKKEESSSAGVRRIRAVIEH